MLPSGYPVHVVHRGNNHVQIFRSEGDYDFFRHCLEKGGIGQDVGLHSYVFMTNHVHLLMTAKDETGISKLIQSAARRYVGYFNKKYARTGTLWEGRFHSTPITTDHYLLACHRYIDMNPVRAGLVQSPESYRWSSHRHYALGSADALLTTHPVIVALASDDKRRIVAYRRLFETTLPESEIDAIRHAAKGSRRLGEVPSQFIGRRGRPRKNGV